MLIGNKVVLEEISQKSLEPMRLWRNDPNLRQFFRCYKDISQEQQQKWYNERGNNSNPEHIYFQIMSKGLPFEQEEASIKSRYLIGCCNLSYIDYRMRSAEFGIYLDPAEHGQGKGKDALILMFDWGFKELNLHKIWAECYDNNYSIGLYHHIGFKDDGILRDNYYHNGKYGNSYMLSMLENEWREKYGNGPLWKLTGEKK